MLVMQLVLLLVYSGIAIMLVKNALAVLLDVKTFVTLCWVCALQS